MRGKTTPAIAMLALLIMAFTASAVTVDDCISLIEETRKALDATDIICRNEEQVHESLESKLDNAIVKLNAGNYDCALNQLKIFEAKVLDLAASPKPKIDEFDANALLTAVGDAIDCVGTLIDENSQ